MAIEKATAGRSGAAGATKASATAAGLHKQHDQEHQQKLQQDQENPHVMEDEYDFEYESDGGPWGPEEETAVIIENLYYEAQDCLQSKPEKANFIS